MGLLSNTKSLFTGAVGSAVDSRTPFMSYVENGTKLSSFKNFFALFESLSASINTIKGLLNALKNLPDALKSDLLGSFSLDSIIAEKLGELGLSSRGIQALNEMTGGSLLSMDSYIASVYNTLEGFTTSIINDIAGQVVASIYIPEEVFLLSVQAMALAKSDPNRYNTLYYAALEHDLAKTLKWLDEYNNTSYDYKSEAFKVGDIAAKKGSWNVARYCASRLREERKNFKDNAIVLSETDQKALDSILMTYEKEIITIIRDIWVYSYSNLNLEDYIDIIEENKEVFSPSNMGTNDPDYHKLLMISNNDINTMAPLYYYEEKVLPFYTDKRTYINPRNKNIKLIYVYLAFNSSYDDKTRLIHQDLHKRLEYKIFTSTTKAGTTAESILVNSPLGRFVYNTVDDYLSMISNYTNKVENLLFAPYKQNGLIFADTISIPDFKPDTNNPNNNTPSQDNDIANSLPKLNLLEKYGLSFESFEIIRLANKSENCEPITISSKSLNIVRKKRSLLNVREFSVKLFSTEDSSLIDDYYLIFFPDSVLNMSESEMERLFNYIIAKYLIDYYLKLGWTLEQIAAIYPGLKDLGIFDEFKNYVNALTSKDKVEEDDEINENGGTELPNGIIINYDSLHFYTSIILENGNSIKITESGIYEFDVNGNSIRRFQVDGYHIGIAISNNYLFVLTLISGQKTIVYTSLSDGIFYNKDSNFNENELTITAGSGIQSISQFTFYKNFYYDGYIFSIEREKGVKGLCYYDPETPSAKNPIQLYNVSEQDLLGLTFSSVGYLYVLIDNYGVIEIKDYKKEAQGDNASKVENWKNDKFKNDETKIGTIIDNVRSDLSDEYDIDINNKNIQNQISENYGKDLAKGRFLILLYKKNTEENIIKRA